MPVQVIFSRNVIDQAAMERVYSGADDELMRIAKEIAAASKQRAPVGGKKRSKASRLYGRLRGSIKAVRKGKRMRRNGRWTFLATKIAIRMAFYGKFQDEGWVHAKSGMRVPGTGFITSEINRRLVNR